MIKKEMCCVHLKTSTYIWVFQQWGMFHIKKNAYNSSTKLLLGALKYGYISSLWYCSSWPCEMPIQ